MYVTQLKVQTNYLFLLSSTLRPTTNIFPSFFYLPILYSTSKIIVNTQMTKRPQEHTEPSDNNSNRHKKKNIRMTQNINLNAEDNKKRRQQRIQLLKKRKAKQTPNIHHNSEYLINSSGMVNFSADYIKYLKESYAQKSYLGQPDYKCKYCDAIFWFNERNKHETERNKQEIVYSNCCKRGQIKIPKFQEPPTYLKNLLNPNGDKICKHFLQKIRQYNSMFAFTSMGANIDKTINQREGPYIFRINGQVHHQIGSLLPLPNTSPKFLELYIFDTENEIQNRINALTKEDASETDISPDIVTQLKLMLVNQIH